MAVDYDAVTQDAMVLPPEQRLALANRLFDSVESEGDSEVEAAWTKEIIRRIAEYDAGGVQAIPAEEVFDRIRRKHSDRP